MNTVNYLVVDHPLKFFDVLDVDFVQISLGLEVIFAFNFTEFDGMSRVGTQMNRVQLLRGLNSPDLAR